MNGDRSRFVLCCVGLALMVSGCASPLGNGGHSPGIGALTAPSGWGWPSWLYSPSDPGNTLPENPLAVARLNERRGQIEQAERLYKEIIHRSPNNPVAYHRLAVISARRGKGKEAEEYFAAAMALKPGDPELLSDLGYFYYLSGRLQEAEASMRQAVEIEPNDARYCNNLALVVGKQGRDEESLAYFSRTNSPNDVLLNHAFVLAQRNEYGRAMDAYDRALTNDRSSRVAADALIELSKYAPPTGTSGGSSVLAARSAFPHAGYRVASSDSPVADERSTAPMALTSPPSKLPPSTFSSSALAAAPQSAPQPLTQSSAHPPWQVPSSYLSTGFSEAMALRPEVGPPRPRMARLPDTAASHLVPPQARRMARFPRTTPTDRAPAYP